MRLALALAAALCGACEPPCEPGDICAIAGSGELGFNGDGLDLLDTRIASPTSVRQAPDGAVVIVDYSNMRLRVIEDDTLRTVVGDGVHAYSEPGAAVLDTPLENPVDVGWDAEGQLYILPQHEGRVIRVEDGRVALYAGTGELADGGDDEPAIATTMGYGGGMAFADDGSLYVSDASFSRVRRVTPEGRVEHVLGIGSAGLGEPGHGPSTAIAFPERVVVDEALGRLIVADTGNHRVLALDLASLVVTVIAGTGERGDAHTGDALTTQLSTPTGVEVAPDGTVLIADLDHDRIVAVSPDGDLRTVAGAPGPYEPVRAAEPLAFGLRRPAGLSWTDDGDLLIAERSGHRALRWLGAADAL